MVEEVYAFVHNPDNSSEWRSGLLSVKYPDGARAVGTQFIEVRKFMSRQMETTLEITALKPDRKYVTITLSGPGPDEVTLSFES